MKGLFESFFIKCGVQIVVKKCVKLCIIMRCQGIRILTYEKYSRGRGKKIIRIYQDQDKSPRSSTTSKEVQTTAAHGTSEVRNRMIDTNILFPELEKLLTFIRCHGKMQLYESNAQGLSFKIEVVCVQCGQLLATNLCKKVGSKNHVHGQ